MISDAHLSSIGVTLLNFAESKFGPRENITFKGFRFSNIHQPMIFGHRLIGYEILIGEAARTSECQTIFQAAHEVIHLLSPPTVQETSTFEEGLATYFSIQCLKKFCSEKEVTLQVDFLRTKNENYFDACELMTLIEPPYEYVIKKIRQDNPDILFSNLGAEQLSRYPEIPPDIIPALIKKFHP